MVKCLKDGWWMLERTVQGQNVQKPRRMLYVSSQGRKNLPPQIYIKHSIFRVTIKLRTLPFLQSFRSFNLIEILAVTRNRRPRQRLLFAV